MLRTVFWFTLLGAQMTFAATPALMPMPAKIDAWPGTLPIDASFGVGDTSPRLAPAVKRFLDRVFRQTGIVPSPTGAVTTMRLMCLPCEASPVRGEDESYELNVSSSGAILKAATVAGALHGMETFLQLIEPGPDGFEAPAVRIADHPRFAWRGL